MRFLRRSESSDQAGQTAVESPADTDAAETEDEGATRSRPRTTPGKGRATPKRRDAEGRRRGPAPPPPRTQREAAKLARATRPSKDERRAKALERRKRMDAGDDRVLLPRDRGKVRAYVRDIVDSRPHVIGLFLPLAALVLVAALIQNPMIQQYVTLFTFLMLIVMVVEGTLLGMQVLKKARAKFPDEEIKGLGTGWYAFSRATQPRRMRVPKPRVKRGDTV
ncbi:CblZ, a non-orthologous displasment for Alpha-ribazole-5'-phosphate phosphatase [Pseudonocardia sp. Ae406_Ps2]|uniref:DUF3043 domain-containing protein n=1 Tax=unclassified Pseudonocardia TaxID=2619320 RepID=UPI0002D87C7B|nr:MULTISPECIES: DUF3043 domain-containing protein [unclassified Pseudonocardia]ALE83252.1 hypothetical protein XF36_08835 [Pseudonocardia sp. HH130629-09]OLM01663.1 CblZ, a non-orthologous displasment for Alpha-ribazole-5'-phosphate phosphatase [Pseudonocardia sp. Ae406_Ps2]OLM06553.1 CblZ, a non-orthologous displasment for Alpha-ribazole-5'-phosphate phosphatase [Pseudonocardia sp. Ae331_Ps2]OLM13293.1 CblZ, a non-orthologous displasment for Alpha-ribazole-5'-phosphate phosphatase [Pseudonoca